MSTQLPLRRIRIPSLRQQCLFQRHHNRPQYLALFQPSTAARTFTSTPSRPAKRRQLGQDKAQSKAAAQGQVGPSPRVGLEKAQTSTDAMAEDIGLLQNTIIRPPLSELWRLGVGGLSKYTWDFVKSKGTGMYSRYAYHSCIRKTFWKRFSAFVGDSFNNTQVKTLAKAHYEHFYTSLASGDTKSLKESCLPPLVKKLESRIAARGNLKMTWRLLGTPKASVVSNRAAPLGEDQPNTAYRQIVVRLVSTQILSKTGGSSTSSSTSTSTTSTTPRKSNKQLPWMPDSARQHLTQSQQSIRKLKDEGEKKVRRSKESFPDNGVPKKVVEYFVMQKRVIGGREEDWKVWGFTHESTPERIEEDEEYWRRTLDLQAAGGM